MNRKSDVKRDHFSFHNRVNIDIFAIEISYWIWICLAGYGLNKNQRDTARRQMHATQPLFCGNGVATFFMPSLRFVTSLANSYQKIVKHHVPFTFFFVSTIGKLKKSYQVLVAEKVCLTRFFLCNIS